jgi:sorting nexin-8
LYIATRDLFIRHARLSIDQVERLRKRVETNSVKLEGVKVTQKEGWQVEADRFVGLIERDQATIATQLHRRVFIRAWSVVFGFRFGRIYNASYLGSLWHELRVVLHNRENALLTQAVQTFAGEEQVFAETILANWVSLGNAVESMPFE